MLGACGGQRVVGLPKDPSSAGVSGNGNGGRIEIASSKVSKQRSGVLRLIPRGSNPTMSNRARSSRGSNLATARTNSWPEPPGPPGLSINEPMR